MYNTIILQSILKNQEIKKKGRTTLYGHLTFSDVSDDNDVLPFAEKLSYEGCFAAIIESDEKVTIVADCFRSIPLFYHVSHDSIYIADSADLIAESVEVEIIDDNLRELYYCRCVTEDNETIYKNIFVICAGEIVTISKKDGSVERKTYYQPIYNFSSENDIDQLIDEYDEVLKSVITRLISRVDGRTIAVPLSGGFDSRTIVTMLKRLGYENVCCVSYGVKNSPECQASKHIAEVLGFPWLYTEYSGKMWKEFYGSKDYKDFVKYSCKGVSVGCVQSLPAVLNISKKHLVSDNAVFCPGQTDVAFGTNIKSINEGWYTHQDMIEWVGNQYYAQLGGMDILVRRKWVQELPTLMSVNEYNMYYMKWNMTKRQPGFLLNDVRAYEFGGYAFDLPFLDRECMEFWYKVPLHLLLNRTLQIAHIKKMIDPVAKTKSEFLPKQSNTSIRHLIKKSIVTLFPKEYVKKQKRALIKNYKENINAFYSHMSENEYKNYLEKYGIRFSIDTVVAEDYERDVVRSIIHNN